MLAHSSNTSCVPVSIPQILFGHAIPNLQSLSEHPKPTARFGSRAPSVAAGGARYLVRNLVRASSAVAVSPYAVSAPGGTRTPNPRFRSRSMLQPCFHHTFRSPYAPRHYAFTIFRLRFNQMQILFICGGICGGTSSWVREFFQPAIAIVL